MLDEKIIKAAIAEAYAHGLRFRMSDITKRANISKTTLYNNVDSKTDLINKVLDYLIDNFNEQEKKLAEENLSTKEQIAKLLQLYIESFRLYDRELYSDLRADYEDEWKRCMSFRKAKLDAIIKLLQDGISRGELRRADLNVIRQFIIPAAEALFNESFLKTNKLTYQKAVEHFCDILFTGLEQ